jgi:GTP-binding protein
MHRIEKVRVMQIKTAEFVRSATRRADFPRDLQPQIAFAGRSNVGKSSLLNTLVRRKQLARTSSTPGRTRQINFFLINGALYFVDLPGYGYAKVPKAMRHQWGKLIEDYLRDNPALKAFILILDARRLPEQEEFELLEWLALHNIPLSIVVTKTDKISRGELMNQMRHITAALQRAETISFIPFSAKTGQGRDEILKMIESRLKNS